MANKMQIKRGNKANLPVLSDGELAFCKDAKELFIGSSGANQQVGTLIQSGPWTPTVSGNTTYSKRVGTYYKIGNMVTAQCDLSITMNSSKTPFIISGLPFVSSSEATTLISFDNGWFYSRIWPMAHVSKSSSTVDIFCGWAVNDSNIDKNIPRSGEGVSDTISISFILTYLTA